MRKRGGGQTHTHTLIQRKRKKDGRRKRRRGERDTVKVTEIHIHTPPTTVYTSYVIALYVSWCTSPLHVTYGQEVK